MGLVRKILLAAAGGALLVSGMPAVAEPPEPLIVTRLADPDPSYVPPPQEKRGRRQFNSDEQSVELNAAMQDFSQALSLAMQLQQQAMDERCKSTQSAAASGMDRMAWEAACKYTRR